MAVEIVEMETGSGGWNGNDLGVHSHGGGDSLTRGDYRGGEVIIGDGGCGGGGSGGSS